MDAQTLKSKVTAKLIKNGNNISDVDSMVDQYFEYASSKYNTVKSISECIVSIY